MWYNLSSRPDGNQKDPVHNLKILNYFKHGNFKERKLWMLSMSFCAVQAVKKGMNIKKEQKYWK